MKLSINLASRRHINQQGVKLCLRLMIVVLLGLLWYQGNRWFQDHRQLGIHHQHLEELRRERHQVGTEGLTPNQIAEQQANYDRARQLLERDAFRWTELFDRLEVLIPENISLTSFVPSYSERSLTMNGLSKDLESLQALLDNLYAASFLQVYLLNQGETKIDDQLGTEKVVLTFAIQLGGVF